MGYRNLGIFVVIATIVSQATWVQATKWMVGDEQGWVVGVDYEAWVRGKQFVPGDELRFVYDVNKCSIDVVTKEGYDTCTREQNVKMAVPLCGNNGLMCAKPGTWYFTGGRDENCRAGQKLAITVVPAPANLEESTDVLL